MKKIELEELRVIQMDILSAVHHFCCKKNIKYSLACGTMLGCARHKGYIPWDDDIDICLLRDDYNRMVKEFPPLLNDRYKFCTMERDKKWASPYGKVCNEKTIIYEGKNSFGINIDVFPIDKVPEDQEKWLTYDKLRRLIIRLYSERAGDYYQYHFKKERNIFVNLTVIGVKFILNRVPINIIAKAVDKYAKIYNKSNSEKVFECVQGIFLKKPFSCTLFEELILMPFEDREFLAFKNYDEYLTNGFGNWRQLPPVEKRITHHIFQAWWK